MNRIIKWIVFICLIICLLAIYIFKNQTFRTQLFRSFAKGNWYITSDKDTIYSCGYYGIKKYVIDGTALNLLAENDNFCKNTLIARGIAVSDKYVYVSARSFLAGAQSLTNEGFVLGSLLVLDKKTLEIVNKIDRSYKVIECQIAGDYLVVDGINNFEIFDISIPHTPKVIFKHKADKYTEFQGCSVFKTNDSIFVAFPQWDHGMSIWNITEPKRSYQRAEIEMLKPLVNGMELPKGSQEFHLLVDYPYIYSTLGPSHDGFQTGKNKRGILVYDITNMDSISVTGCFVPENLWYKKSTGDLQPTYISKKGNVVYTNFAEQGVATFDVSIPMVPAFREIIKASDNYNLIQPIHINNKGILLAGSYYWSTIYLTKLK